MFPESFDDQVNIFSKLVEFSEGLSTSWLCVIILAIVTIVAYIYVGGSSLKRIHKTPEQRKTDYEHIFGTLVMAFLAAFSTVAAACGQWIINFDGSCIPLPIIRETSADGMRVLYESHSLLGLGGSIVLAASSLFIPFLVTLWNNTLSGFSFQLERYHQLSQAHSSNNILKIKFDKICAMRHEIKKFGRDYRLSFVITVMINLFLILSAAIFHFIAPNPLAYKLSAILAALGLLLFVWYLTLFLAFIFIVQTNVGKYDYSEIFIDA